VGGGDGDDDGGGDGGDGGGVGREGLAVQPDASDESKVYPTSHEMHTKLETSEKTLLSQLRPWTVLPFCVIHSLPWPLLAQLSSARDSTANVSVCDPETPLYEHVHVDVSQPLPLFAYTEEVAARLQLPTRQPPAGAHRPPESVSSASHDWHDATNGEAPQEAQPTSAHTTVKFHSLPVVTAPSLATASTRHR